MKEFTSFKDVLKDPESRAVLRGIVGALFHTAKVAADSLAAPTGARKRAKDSLAEAELFLVELEKLEG